MSSLGAVLCALFQLPDILWRMKIVQAALPVFIDLLVNIWFFVFSMDLSLSSIHVDEVM